MQFLSKFFKYVYINAVSVFFPKKENEFVTYFKYTNSHELSSVDNACKNNCV